MTTPIEIDVAALAPGAQKIIDPSGPPPLRQMAAKGIAPGLKPGDALAVVILLARSADANVSAAATATLEKLPVPLLNGALGARLQAGVLDAIAPFYAKDPAVAEKILMHPDVHPSTVATMASRASEAVAELIATNEQRLLENPVIIEKLYLNKSTRMSTADRILELAVRNKLELNGLPAFKEAAAAIADELIAEPTPEKTFDDIIVDQALEQLAMKAEADAAEDTMEIDEATGQEVVKQKYRPLHAIWGQLNRSKKIRLLQIGSVESDHEDPAERERLKAIGASARMMGVRDADAMVAAAAIRSPNIQEDEVIRYSAIRNISDEVLRIIATNREWTKSYQVKYNLVANPKTPFAFAAKFVMHLRDNDIKVLAKSKDVSGAVANACKQHLSRKQPPGK
jgi:DNA-binding transcriptional regulator YdaS (Cro superfamily)